MEELKQRIMAEGRGVADKGAVLVGSFLNHQLDPQLMMHCAQEFVRLFKDQDINKIVTIEASGIAPAILVGYLMGLPVVFVKKKIPKTVEEYWKSWVYSFTKGETTTVCVDRQFLTADDRILFIDDFLADGHASRQHYPPLPPVRRTDCGHGLPGRERLCPGRPVPSRP